MRVKSGWVWGVLALALVGQANATVSEVLADVTNHGTRPIDFVRNVSMGAVTTLNGKPARTINFNGVWSGYGQNLNYTADWSRFNGSSLTIRNHSQVEADLALRVSYSPDNSRQSWSRIVVPAGATVTFLTDQTSFDRNASGMAYPIVVFEGEYTHFVPYGETAFGSPYMWEFYLRSEDPVQLTVSDFMGYTFDRTYSNSIDEFGQFTGRNWAEKVTSTNDLIQDVATENAALNLVSRPDETHGSLTLPTTTATGKWRVVRSPSGNAYFVTPQGRYFWSMGVTSVNFAQPTIVQGRENMFTSLPSQSGPSAPFYGTQAKNGQNLLTFDFYQNNLLSKFGTNYKREAIILAERRLRAWGINTMGSGTALDFMDDHEFPYCWAIDTQGFSRAFTVPFGWNRTIPDPYDSRFATDLRSYLDTNGFPYFILDEDLMGIYVGVELAWGKADGTTREKYQLPLAVLESVNTSAKLNFWNQLFARYRSIANINAVYQTNFTSVDSFLNAPVRLSDAQLTSRVAGDLSRFLTDYVITYHNRIKSTLSGYNGKFLYLGSRDNLAVAPSEVFTAAGKVCDVISVNIYERSEDLPLSFLTSQAKPVLISEFSFVGQDRNGATAAPVGNIITRSQTERLAEARSYLDTMVRHPNVIGTHWFKYTDQPLTGRAEDGENLAFGLVDVNDRPYGGLTQVFSDFTRTMYSTRGL